MSAQNPKKLVRINNRAALAERLRTMRWPEPTPETRQRAWELLRARIEALGG